MTSLKKSPLKSIFIVLIACITMVGATQFSYTPNPAQAAFPQDETTPPSIKLTPGSAGQLISADGKVQVDFPAASVTTDTDVTLYSMENSLNASDWRGDALLSFVVRAADADGAQITTLEKPSTITVKYDDPADPNQENLLKLFYWKEIPGEWQEASTLCSPASTYTRDTTANQLSVDVCALGEFALLLDKHNLTFMPFAGYVKLPSYSISGQVTDEYGSPIEGVEVEAGSANSTSTDNTGMYVLGNLDAGVYTLNLRKGGYSFPNSGMAVNVSSSQSGVNFTAALAPGCYEEVVNGKFENDKGWKIHGSTFPAGYTYWRAHKGLRSMRTGFFDVLPYYNFYNFSVFSQYVDIPTSTTAVTLTFWIYQHSDEDTMALLSEDTTGLEEKNTTGQGELATVAGDANYVKILDTNHNVLATLVNAKEDTHAWVKYSFLLDGFDGQRLQLLFGTYNDGEGGNTGMLVDDVSLTPCVEPPTPEPTPEPGCNTNLVKNSRFENTNGWVIRGSQYLARYTNEKSHGGKWSMLTGITSWYENTFSYSVFTQSINIPITLTSAMLDYWIYARTTESTIVVPLAAVPTTELSENSPEATLSGDIQYLALKDAHGTITYLLWQRSNANKWVNLTADLTPYAGQTVELKFGTYNDGDGGVTAMYVDDVTVTTACE